MDCMDWEFTNCQLLPVDMDVDPDTSFITESISKHGQRSSESTIVHSDKTHQVDCATNVRTDIASYMVWPNAMQLFETMHQEVLDFWSRFMRRTSLPPNITLSDPGIPAALAAIDNILVGKNEPDWKLRLAQVRLAQVASSILSIIASGRRKGRIPRRVGKGNASILIDTYIKAQSNLQSKELRLQMQRRIRIARRWADLIGGSIFLAVVYSNKAEIAIRNFSVTNATIKAISRQLHEACTAFLPTTSMHSNIFLDQENDAKDGEDRGRHWTLLENPADTADGGAMKKPYSHLENKDSSFGFDPYIHISASDP